MWVSGTAQLGAAERSHELQQHAQELLTSMLDQQTGRRGFLLTGREEFLDPYREGLRNYERSVRALEDRLDEENARTALGEVTRTAEIWQKYADDLIPAIRERGPRNAESVATALVRKRYFDAFRTASTELLAVLEEDRIHDEGVAAVLAAAISLVIALLIGSIGGLVIGRQIKEARARRHLENQAREAQTEFVETMQLADDEDEAHDLLRRHIERSLPGSQVVVLNRNNSADHLEPATRVDDGALAERLEGAHPRACLAVRLGHENSRDADEDPLLTCELCGAVPGSAICQPLVVGSEVIGSVLVTQPGSLDDKARERLRDSVAQAAPALANLRNLALAERRAATDALTGLPNRRSIDDTLKRMVAQASRTVQPLSALMIDLNHFKTINDLYGHEAGDGVLAKIGDVLHDSLRASDFAGRQGGEEFVVLAPDTDRAGALVLAENLRATIERTEVPVIEHRITASIGVATLPDVASNGQGLFRMADRGLYAAKERGRNRVETVDAPPNRPAQAPAAD